MDSQNLAPSTLQATKMPMSTPKTSDTHTVTKRLQTELMQLMMSSTPGISAFPDSDGNMLRWTGTITGPDGTYYR